MNFDRWIYWVLILVVGSGLIAPFFFTPSALFLNRGEMAILQKRLENLEEKFNQILYTQKNQGDFRPKISFSHFSSTFLHGWKKTNFPQRNQTKDFATHCNLSPSQKDAIARVIRQVHHEPNLEKDFQVRKKIEKILLGEQIQSYREYLQQEKKRF